MNENESHTQTELQKQCRRIVHDLRTQLFCIEINGKSLQLYMQELLTQYKKNRDDGTATLDIPSEHLEVLSEAGVDIEYQLSIINEKLDKLLQQFETRQTEANSERLGTVQNTTPFKAPKNTHLHILLVEDEEIHQDICRKVLSSFDCTLDIVVNGMQALQKLQEKQFDLVLMDLHMPQMDGMTTAQEIRKLDSEHRTLPIIGLSNIEPQNSHEFFEAGFNRFLLKPLKLDALIDTIRQLDAHGEP